ncbi:hypothetical protein [Deinococcus peraridilitoris]|uniref:Uncharacterized protein n=1 Tax=Deinococcus peraridilitoris (strain DSM 19664 / LMG 22246 / CIP 109416 / KR-200) TaxID=937777 RepID=L0A1Z3_DEIPD|nr:hypothetical protein [Deinococcus peraridilitoris]AFZ67866.1 hypothetical protein Deipe_2390 [Deinococcus peraridilitoris DSM 19664]
MNAANSGRTGLFGRLRSLGKSPDPAQVRAALREAYLTAFGLLAAPGLLLGLMFGRALRLDGAFVIVLLVLAALLALLAIWLAARGKAQEETPLAGAVRACFQLVAAPAVPFLMGCALLGQASAVMALWSLALLIFMVGFWLSRP